VSGPWSGPLLRRDHNCLCPHFGQRNNCGRAPSRVSAAEDLHFITCSCYRRQLLLGAAPRRDLFLVVLEQVRWRYQFVVGYVVMPEHIHLHSQPQKHVRHLTLTKLLSARPPIPVALPIFFPKKGIVPPEATALSKM